MIARRAKRIRRESGVAVVIAACALAGCTSGPGAQTAERDSTTDGTAIAKTQPEERTESRAIAKRMRAMFQRPEWFESLVNKPEPAPADPFVLARAESRREAANVLVDYTPVKVQPVEFQKPGFISNLTPWDHAKGEQELDCTPVIIRPAAPETANRKRAFEDHRYYHPGDHAASDPAVQVGEPRTSSTNENRQRTHTVTLSDYLNGASQQSNQFVQSSNSFADRSNHFEESSNDFTGQSHTRPETSANVIHGDMIINSAAVSWQFKHRFRPISAEEPIRTISAERPQRRVPQRRPFFENEDGGAGWSDSTSHPSVSANIPVSVTPAIPRTAERTSSSNYRIYQNRTPLFMEVPQSRGTASTGNPFGEIEGQSAALADQELTGEVKSAKPTPTLAAVVSPSQSVVEAPRPRPARHLAKTETEPVPPLASALNLKRAKYLATKQANNPATPDIRTPVTVGMGLAAVIIGAAMIRGRLA